MPERGSANRAGASRAGANRAGAKPAGANRAGAKPAGAKRAGARPAARAAAAGGDGQAARGGTAGGDGQVARIGVRKTYKLYIGGAFPRSESGRSYQVTGPDGGVLANAALASRKDARDAVVAARAAVSRWSGATAYNRGQVLYRVAELLEGRAAQFAAEIAQSEGGPAAAAAGQVARAIDRWVWYAGWTDKISQVAGAANPVAGPYFNFSVPEPSGVVSVIAPQRPSLLGLVSVLAPVIATGNTAVVVASEQHPLPAVTLTEVLATSDVPGGVVNLLTGRTAELAPVLAAHMDVNAIDLSGVAGPARAGLEELAAGNVKRVFAGDDDWAGSPGLRRLVAFLETKTVWHPVGI
ncbi:MAG TPA: aldehyde dehydrogenase family protein [Streptosporangiaceae bacterium]|jgi:acyl-CoA reductase-like NAD-dependent aldehyde dehydrogenase